MAKRQPKRRELVEALRAETWPGRNDRGHATPRWNRLFKSFAAVRQLRDTEVNQKPQTTAEAVYEFNLPFRPTAEQQLDHSCRLKWRERTFNIVSIDNVEGRNRVWLLRAVEDTSPRENASTC